MFLQRQYWWWNILYISKKTNYYMVWFCMWKKIPYANSEIKDNCLLQCRSLVLFHTTRTAMHICAKYKMFRMTESMSSFVQNNVSSPKQYSEIGVTITRKRYTSNVMLTIRILYLLLYQLNVVQWTVKTMNDSNPGRNRLGNIRI